MNRTDTLLLAVFGAVMLTLGVVLAGAWQIAPAHAGTADSGSGVVAASGLASSNQEVLYLFDTESRRLAVYNVNASNRLTLIAVRDTTYDLKPTEFGKQEPSVAELKEAFKKHQGTLGGEDGDAMGRGRR